jgi:hypothetical protein
VARGTALISPSANDYTIATGTAEVGGWTTRELLSILDGLVGLEVVGADVGMSQVHGNAMILGMLTVIS